MPGSAGTRGPFGAREHLAPSFARPPPAASLGAVGRSRPRGWPGGRLVRRASGADDGPRAVWRRFTPSAEAPPRPFAAGRSRVRAPRPAGSSRRPRRRAERGGDGRWRVTASRSPAPPGPGGRGGPRALDPAIGARHAGARRSSGARPARGRAVRRPSLRSPRRDPREQVRPRGPGADPGAAPRRRVALRAHARDGARRFLLTARVDEADVGRLAARGGRRAERRLAEPDQGRGLLLSGGRGGRRDLGPEPLNAVGPAPASPKRPVRAGSERSARGWSGLIAGRSCAAAPAGRAGRIGPANATRTPASGCGCPRRRAGAGRPRGPRRRAPRPPPRRPGR